MKKYFLFLIAIIAFKSQGLTQGDNLIKSANQHTRFVYDTSSTSFLELPGYIPYFIFNAEGEVFDVNNDKIAELKANKDIEDMNGARIGKYDNDWKVYDVNDAQIGTITEDGRVLDGLGVPIGYYTGIVPKQYLVYYYFFSGIF